MCIFHLTYTIDANKIQRIEGAMALNYWPAHYDEPVKDQFAILKQPATSTSSNRVGRIKRGLLFCYTDSSDGQTNSVEKPKEKVM